MSLTKFSKFLVRTSPGHNGASRLQNGTNYSRFFFFHCRRAERSRLGLSYLIQRRQPTECSSYPALNCFHLLISNSVSPNATNRLMSLARTWHPIISILVPNRSWPFTSSWRSESPLFVRWLFQPSLCQSRVFWPVNWCAPDSFFVSEVCPPSSHYRLAATRGMW